MYLTIGKLQNEIVKRGGKIVDDKEDVLRKYTMSGDFEKEKILCENIMTRINPQYDSKVWEDDNLLIQKSYNFKMFTNEEQLYFKRGNIINKITVYDEDDDLLGEYVKKTVIDREHTYHELLVGLVLNNLKGDVKDNFIFTYNFDEFSTTRKSVGRKEKTKDTVNIYMEYVNGKSFGSAILKKSSLFFLTIYYNIALIIKDAYVQLGFIHFDLHTANIIIQKLSESRLFEYSDGRVVEGDKHIKIIDYGFSTIKYKKNIYKIKKNERLFLGENDNPITDCFKLLIHSYKKINSSKKANKNMDRDIFDSIFAFFFKDTNIDDLIDFNEKNNHYNNLPKYYKTSGIKKMDEFIEYLLELYNRKK